MERTTLVYSDIAGCRTCGQTRPVNLNDYCRDCDPGRGAIGSCKQCGQEIYRSPRAGSSICPQCFQLHR